MKLSIITVVFNNASTIADAVLSVKNQTHQNHEHIIIDGGSTDGTMEVINSFRNILSKVVSEPDKGIYDAMNKGIALSTGDAIGFLNADDMYAHNRVFDLIAETFKNTNAGSVYGDIVYVDRFDLQKIVRYWKSGEYNEKLFYSGWMPPHPTFFVKRDIFYKYGFFNTSLGSSADYELILRFLLKNKITISYVPEVLVKMRTGGVSNANLKNRLKANQADRLAWRVNELKPKPWTLLLKPLSKIRQYLIRHKGKI